MAMQEFLEELKGQYKRIFEDKKSLDERADHGKWCSSPSLCFSV